MNKLLKVSAAGVALAATSLQAQIEINEWLSVGGFIDMSAGYTDSETDYTSTTSFNDPAIDDTTSTTSGGSDETFMDLDQVEIDFFLNFGDLTAQIDLDYQGDNDFGGEIDLEQAFLTYTFDESSSLTFGKFLSFHGWETAEPTGLYQFSYAYVYGTIPGYQDGISYSYTSDVVDVGVSLVDGIFDEDGQIGNSDYGFEAKIVVRPSEGWTLYLGYALDSTEGPDYSLINFWASYELDIHTFAFEYNIVEDFGAESAYYSGTSGYNTWDVDQFLFMYNVALSEAGSLTFRYSNEESEGNLINPYVEEDGESETFTLAYLHQATENLALVFEVSMRDTESTEVTTIPNTESGGTVTSYGYTMTETWDTEETWFAVEALFTY